MLSASPVSGRGRLASHPRMDTLAGSVPESQPPHAYDDSTKLIAARSVPVKTRKRPRVRWSDGAGDHELAIDERTLVGSAPKARLVVSDPTVSRLHCELEPRDDGVWVHDLGSKNGTFIGETRVVTAMIRDGAELVLGKSKLQFERAPTPGLVSLWHEERFGPLVGGSAPMRELFARLSRVADSDAPVLVEGETGTGKELVARAIHDRSSRASKPFVIIDCASLPEHLLETELFGHAKGAFTGASSARAGAIEAADEGTVFLDEIGELPLAMQPKLLRVLESKTVRRIGETSHRAVDVRFLSATHRDLRTMVNAGAFREDLYFRLAVLPVVVPSLRERAADVPRLIGHFLRGRGSPFTMDMLDALAARPWLGNVRELRNFVERAMALGAHEAIALTSNDPAPPSRGGGSGTPASGTSGAWSAVVPQPSEGPPTLDVERPMKELREEWLDHFEREYVGALLSRHQRNVAAAAQAAGVDRTYLYRLIKKHRI
jgi:two-component system, NtrC family, response regulator GlrR